MSTSGLIEVTLLYGKGRTQVPSEVRQYLNLKDGDKLAWYINSDGTIYIRKVEPPIRYSKLRP